MNQTEQPKHAKYSPSSTKNREICPGWVNDQTSDTTFATEGTNMHTATETGDLTGLLEQEQRETVQKCLDYVKGILAKRTVIQDHKEKRLTILGGLTFGTADRVIIYRVGALLHADILDWKYGRHGVDDAAENRQGYCYVLGVFEEFDVESVRVHFLLPRRDEVTTHVFTRADIPRLSLIVKTGIAKAQLYAATKDESLLNLTESNCAYCGNKATCPKMLTWGLTIAKKYAPLEIVDEVHSSQITDPAKMAALYTAAKVMEKLVDSVKAHVMDFARNNEMPGYVIAERAGSTKITNALLAYPVLSTLFDPAELASASTYSYTDLQKIISDKTAKGKKSEAVRALFTTLMDADAVKIGEGTQYLKRIKSTTAVTE